MDDLRWILAVFGVVMIAAIYFSGRFERDKWKRDREGFGHFPDHDKKPVQPVREEPQINLQQERAHVSVVEVEEDVKTEAKEATPGTKKEISEVESGPEKKSKSTPNVKEFKPTPESKPAWSQSVGIKSEEDVKKALGTGEPKAEEEVIEKAVESTNESQAVEVDWESVIESAREPLIEDEIVDVEIPEEISEIDKKPKEETELKFKPGVEDPELEKPELEVPEQQELLLEIDPLVLVLTVMAKGDDYIEGKLIKRVLEGSGLKCDGNGIFQFHMTGKKDAVFSIVSVVEPGIFDIATINEYETPGLSFFCQLPGPLPNKDMFRIMQMKALNIADKLGGQLCDDKRNLLTEQATTHYYDRITEFDREIVLAQKKQE